MRMEVAKQLVQDAITGIETGFDYAAYEDVEKDKLEPILEACKLFFTRIISLKLTEVQVKEDAKLLDISTNIFDLIWNAIQMRQASIKSGLRSLHIEISKNHLRDFDWKIHYSLANDRLVSQKVCYLILYLKIASDQNPTHQITIEMTTQELTNLILVLEQANQELIKWL
ncbi:uncharacterized protein LOC126318607 [Schistocerca gregaria]|uniref:uncharacterized protein LOC126318607 n=1 Tax=Schistocerca gregaria TaxID=7010 RepID=UPI00211E84BD|nr:uncharacterized protein LOC126318607 [Schistocerca gregaria]